MAWPTTIPTRNDLHVVVNDWRAALTADINSTQTGIAVSTATVGGNSIPNQGIISIGTEIVRYNGINTAGLNPILLNCTRGYDGTQAKSWPTNTPVELRWVATHHNIIADTLLAVMQSLGIEFLDATQQRGSGVWPNLKTKLDATLPLIVPFTAATNWTAQHTRRRVVAVELYELIAPDTYRKFDAPITQTVNASGTGPSTVTVEPFTGAISGVMVIL